MKSFLYYRLNLLIVVDFICLYLFSSYVIVVEHDLSVLDYLSDFICCLYGKPGAYGVVTLPFSVREGINIFLDGFVPTENLRFRDDRLTFKVNVNMLVNHPLFVAILFHLLFISPVV